MSASTFPTTIDTFTTKVDITSADVVNVNRYRELKSKTSLTASEQAELSGLVVTLANKMMSPDDFNKLQDCIVALEVFVKNNVDGYFQQKQTEFDAILQQFSNKGLWSNLTTYAQWNTVSFNNETYLSKQNNNLNHEPVGDISDLWWQKVALRGAQGQAGIGLSWASAYDNAKTYQVGNAVSYNNNIYYCIQQSTGNLPTNQTYWDLFLSNSGIVVSSTAPSAPYTGQIFIDSSVSPSKIKHWDGTQWVEVGASANKVTITDSGDLITATNVEDGLQELTTKINANTTKIDNTQKFIPALGTATAITLTTGYFNLINNQSITFIASANNNGATTTINADAKGARNVYKPNTTTAPTFIAGKAYTVWYNTTSACFFIKASAEGNTVAGHVLAGDTFSNDSDTGLVGTMPNRGTVNQSLAINGEYTIPEGYHNGLGKVTQNITTKSAQTYTPSQSTQTIASGQYLTGNQTISAVSFDASKVLTGTTIAGKAGTMPNRAGDTAALAISRSGTTIKLRASNGYRDGVDDNVTYNEPNWVAANIPQGMSMFGLAGTNTNKKWASGTVPANTYTVAGGSSEVTHNVTGLPFNPRFVLVISNHTRGGNQLIYARDRISDAYPVFSGTIIYGFTNDTTYNSYFGIRVVDLIDNTFKIIFRNDHSSTSIKNCEFTWYAIE